jgi:hypothetical protein
VFNFITATPKVEGLIWALAVSCGEPEFGLSAMRCHVGQVLDCSMFSGSSFGRLDEVVDRFEEPVRKLAVEPGQVSVPMIFQLPRKN